MGSSKEEFIKDKIKRSGYPLELEIASIIKSNDNWSIINDTYFFDKDSNKDREFDINAGIMTEKDTNYSLDMNLFIQCKKIPGNNWIFFKTHSFPVFNIFYELTYFEIAEKLPFAVNANIFDKNKLHFKNCDTIASRYIEVICDSKKSNKKLDNIFGSTMTLLKAILYKKKSSIAKEKRFVNEGILEGRDILNKPFSPIVVYYPVIVFDGDIYESNMVNNKIVIKPVNYVKLLVPYEDRTFCIDVVKKDYFKIYFEQINKDFLLLEKRIEKQSKKWDSEIMKIFDNYVEKYLSKSISEKTLF